MSVQIKVGDMFQSNAQTIINTVNCVGVMGKGIALEFKKRFPEMYEDYVKKCDNKEVRLGKPYLYKQDMLKWILNFPTKDNWRSVSKLEDIINGLKFLKQHYKEWGITSLAVPPLGCGFGGLEWRVVGKTLFRYLLELDIPVELYAPHGTPTDQLTEAFLMQNGSSKINPAYLALVEIIARIEKEKYHWPVGRTVFQKIAYFATSEGLPTGLQFKRASYGPFSEQLKHVESQLLNNGLISTRQNDMMIEFKVGHTYMDAEQHYSKDLEQWEGIIQKVTDLFLRMQRKDAEIAATVHFVYQELSMKEKEPSEMDIFNEVKVWKQRRRPKLDDNDIARYVRDLNVLHWLKARASNDLPLKEDF